MELNRYQALDILEKFNFFQGHRAGREMWSEKPFDAQEQDIANFSRDVALLKDYINELTEENEVRKRCNTMLNNELRRIDNIKADTVRDIQTAFAVHFGTCTDKDTVKVSDVFRLLDTIAKEKLEGI